MQIEPWVILTDRIGRDTRSPLELKVDEAIHDLRVHQNDVEHRSISLRRGYDVGPVALIELFADGSVEYSVYEDADLENKKFTLRGRSLGIMDISRRFYYLFEGNLSALDICQWHEKE